MADTTTYRQQMPYDSSRLSATHYYNRDSTSTMYSTYDTRESYVDPATVDPTAGGYSRDTYIGKVSIAIHRKSIYIFIRVVFSRAQRCHSETHPGWVSEFH